MTQEDKNILLKDLCARLPYGVKFNYGDYSGCDYKVELMTSTIVNDFPIEDCKPYLRPMSSMTEEERNEFILISDTVLWLGNKMSTCILSLEQMDWLNSHHFDYRGLIPMGLALEAPNNMYKN